MKQAKVDFNAQDREGRTALILAVIYNHPTLFRQLLYTDIDKGIKDKFDKTYTDYIDRSKNVDIYVQNRIFLAKQKNSHLSNQRVVVSHIKDAKEMQIEVYGIDERTHSPLMAAIKSNDYEQAEAFIKNRQFLEAKSNNGATAIFFAVYYKREKILDLLLETGVVFDLKNSFGVTPLYLAVLEKNKYAVSKLLETGADMYAIDKEKSYTPFTRAVLSGDLEMVELFLAHGVDVNYQYRRSETALTLASKGCKQLDLFKRLLEAGADPDRRDEFGKTTRQGLRRYCRKGGAKVFESVMSNH